MYRYTFCIISRNKSFANKTFQRNANSQKDLEQTIQAINNLPVFFDYEIVSIISEKDPTTIIYEI